MKHSEAAETIQDQINKVCYLRKGSGRFSASMRIAGFVYVPAGTYLHGASPEAWERLYEVENQNGDHQKHIAEHDLSMTYSVTVPYDFFISETYVTNRHFRAFAQAQGYRTIVQRFRTGHSVDAKGTWKKGVMNNWRRPHWPADDDLPVVQVSWGDAMAYAAWLSDQLGAPVRLPTAEEWGLATRPEGCSTEARLFPWGDSLREVDKRINFVDHSAKDYAWAHTQFCDGYKYASPVKAFPRSARGLYDAVGNVWGWTITRLDDQQSRRTAYVSVPRIPNVCGDIQMVMTGGCFLSRLVHCTLAAVMCHPAADGSIDVGFQVVIVPREFVGDTGTR